MSEPQEPVDPRLAYAVSAPSPANAPSPTNEPSPEPSPEPGPSPDPDPDPEPEPSPDPEEEDEDWIDPTPDPSPPAIPPPPPFGDDPDVGVTPGYLRGRANACDAATDLLVNTRGVAKESCEDLAESAEGWEFTKSLDTVESRWTDLLNLMKRRLDYAAESFRESADAYDENESRISTTMRRLHP